MDEGLSIALREANARFEALRIAASEGLEAEVGPQARHARLMARSPRLLLEAVETLRLAMASARERLRSSGRGAEAALAGSLDLTEVDLGRPDAAALEGHLHQAAEPLKARLAQGQDPSDFFRVTEAWLKQINAHLEATQPTLALRARSLSEQLDERGASLGEALEAVRVTTEEELDTTTERLEAQGIEALNAHAATLTTRAAEHQRTFELEVCGRARASKVRVEALHEALVHEAEALKAQAKAQQEQRLAQLEDTTMEAQRRIAQRLDAAEGLLQEARGGAEVARSFRATHEQLQGAQDAAVEALNDALREARASVEAALHRSEDALLEARHAGEQALSIAAGRVNVGIAACFQEAASALSSTSSEAERRLSELEWAGRGRLDESLNAAMRPMEEARREALGRLRESVARGQEAMSALLEEVSAEIQGALREGATRLERALEEEKEALADRLTTELDQLKGWLGEAARGLEAGYEAGCQRIQAAAGDTYASSEVLTFLIEWGGLGLSALTTLILPGLSLPGLALFTLDLLDTLFDEDDEEGEPLGAFQDGARFVVGLISDALPDLGLGALEVRIKAEAEEALAEALSWVADELPTPVVEAAPYIEAGVTVVKTLGFARGLL